MFADASPNTTNTPLTGIEPKETLDIPVSKDVYENDVEIGSNKSSIVSGASIQEEELEVPECDYSNGYNQNNSIPYLPNTANAPLLKRNYTTPSDTKAAELVRKSP